MFLTSILGARFIQNSSLLNIISTIVSNISISECKYGEDNPKYDIIQAVIRFILAQDRTNKDNCVLRHILVPVCCYQQESKMLIISKINHPITSILTSTTTTSTTTPKPVLTTSKSIQTSSKPIQTSLKPIQSTSKPIQITTSKSIRTTSKPFRTTLSKSFRTTVKPKLGQPIFKFSTMNPKDIDITSTMKSIFKIKSNDHVNREKKNRICNGEKSNGGNPTNQSDFGKK
nr:uncharacterized membrane protein DDB_G0293934-like [Dermatophagoides farinae]